MAPRLKNAILPHANALLSWKHMFLLSCSKNMMNYVLPYLINYSCNFPHQQVFTHLEICSNLSLVHVLWVLPCMLRSGLALLVSLWDAGVCELNLLWSDNTSDVFVTQVPSSIKQGFVDALVPKSSKDCKALRHLMVARCLMVGPFFCCCCSLNM